MIKKKPGYVSLFATKRSVCRLFPDGPPSQMHRPQTHTLTHLEGARRPGRKDNHGEGIKKI